MSNTEPKTIPYHETHPQSAEMAAFRCCEITTSAGATVKIGVPEDVDRHGIIHIFTKPDKETGNNVELKFSLTLEACMALRTLYSGAELDRMWRWVECVQVGFTGADEPAQEPQVSAEKPSPR